MSDNKVLKPCPHCGGDPRIIQRKQYEPDEWRMCAYCPSCDPRFMNAISVDLWNTRPEEDRLNQRVENDHIVTTVLAKDIKRLTAENEQLRAVPESAEDDEKEMLRIILEAAKEVMQWFDIGRFVSPEWSEVTNLRAAITYYEARKEGEE
jgi:hypothetical protein